MTSGSGWDEELRRRLHEIFMAEAAERLDALEAAVADLTAEVERLRAEHDALAAQLGDPSLRSGQADQAGEPSVTPPSGVAG